MRDLSKIADALDRSMLGQVSPEEALEHLGLAPVSSCMLSEDCSCGCDYPYPDFDAFDDDSPKDLDYSNESLLNRQENILLRRHDFSWWIPRDAVEKWNDESNLAVIIEPSLLKFDLSEPSADRRMLLRREKGVVTLNLCSLDLDEIPRTSMKKSRSRLAANPYRIDGELEAHFTNVYPDHSYVGELFGYNLSNP